MEVKRVLVRKRSCEADKVASFLLGDGLGEMLGEMLCVVLIEALELQLCEVPGVVLGVVLMS